MGALLHRVGKTQIYLDVRSAMIRAELNPLLEMILKKKKSIWNMTPIGSSVVSLSVPLGILVIPAASQIGHRPGSGANLHGRPGPVISP